MKTIGLLGGMSWESTLEYYRLLNRMVAARVGGFASAKMVMHSVDFSEYEAWLRSKDWGAIAAGLGKAAKDLACIGADMVLICTNTMHQVAGEVQKACGLPLVHIGETTAAKVAAAGMTTVGLLGTKPTMELAFYRDKLTERGITTLVPDAEDRETVHRIIFEELVRGEFREPAKLEYLRIMDELRAKGAQGVVLGCTEIPLLVNETHTDLPLFDTTAIHAEAAVDLALD